MRKGIAPTFVPISNGVELWDDSEIKKDVTGFHTNANI